ncbi:hypothetical protein NFI96_021167 [Prochilodus magdalenae]|nr:hypothetical protein NFI96_021167 [Prochilodus magdalenae]
MPAAGWQPDRPLLPTLSVAVKTAKASTRICQLARSRKLHTAMTRLCNSSEISVSVPSLARPSPRTELLANLTLIVNSTIKKKAVKVNKLIAGDTGKKGGAAAARVLYVKAPKQDHPQYCPDRPISWPVPKSVLEAVASERLQVLATPRLRKPLADGFDPYKVSPAARAATASPRLQELALPPARRCRTR